ncbi:MAG: hypothetical protein JNM43_01280 [Planctomycetaceae bacterium]|nr:hypothetical protein [Planctomycetaceae bacterium]
MTCTQGLVIVVAELPEFPERRGVVRVAMICPARRNSLLSLRVFAWKQTNSLT